MCGMNMTDKQRNKLLKQKAQLESAVKSLNDYKGNESFEQLIERKFSPYYGMTIKDISEKTGTGITLTPKAAGPRTCHAILGVKAPKITEFEDLETARKVWEDTKAKTKAGVYDSFTKISDKMICHVRPKAKNASDLIPTPQGGTEPKKAFWLNRNYIHKIVMDHIGKPKKQ